MMKPAVFLTVSFLFLPSAALAAGMPDGTASSAPTNFKGRKISVDFQNIDIRTVLQLLSKESGLNIIADERVKGKITLTLKQLPWDQALDVVLQAGNLAMKRQGNTMMIVPQADMLAAAQAQRQARQELALSAPLHTRLFRLKYRQAENLAKLLQGGSQTAQNAAGGILSSRGSARADSVSNTLIVTDTAESLGRLGTLLTDLDTAAEQVMVEARIVEASEGLSRDLGVKFGFSGVNARYAWSNTLGNAQANRHAYQDFGNGTSPDIRYALGPNVNLPVTAATAGIALIRSVSSGALGLELAAQQAQNRARILSSPRVLTQNRQEAVIESGTEIPYEESTSSGATSVNFKKAVLGLTVTPHITPDGKIMMNIKVNKDSVDAGCSTSEPCIRTQRLHTSAMVENGGTLVLGGIYEESDSNAVRKVPLLGDIPYLGNLFKYRSRNQAKNELLVFITPRIVGQPESRPY